jgi:hypothetical protein
MARTKASNLGIDLFVGEKDTLLLCSVIGLLADENFFLLLSSVFDEILVRSSGVGRQSKYQLAASATPAGTSQLVPRPFESQNFMDKDRAIYLFPQLAWQVQEAKRRGVDRRNCCYRAPRQ